MNRLFELEICHSGSFGTETSAALALPATPYKLADALDKARVIDERVIYSTEILNCNALFAPSSAARRMDRVRRCSHNLLEFGIAIPKKVWHCVVFEGGEQMDDKVRELLEQSIAERAQIAFAQMRQADSRLNGLAKHVIAPSEEVEHCAGMDENARDLVQRFLSKSADMDSEFQKYLYIQGARDCVAILRELGVIK